jgi:DNA-binding MarR family transcriptional regulator
MDAWVAILVAVSTVMRALEAEMAEQHELPITWFDVLNRLDQAPDHRLRMHEIEEMSVFTRSGMTRLADRIEAAGLVRRERDAGDRRGVFLAITHEGREKLGEVRPDHMRGIEEHFASHISVSDAATLRSIATRVAGGRPAVGQRAQGPQP